MLINFNKKNINLPPGTLQYAGENILEKPLIDVIKFNKDEYIKFSVKDVDEIVSDNNYIQWINFAGLNHTPLIEKLGNKLDIHKVNLEDIVDVSQRSKIEFNNNYVFSVFKMFYLEKNRIVSEHVSILISNNLLITFQEYPAIYLTQLEKESRITKVKFVKWVLIIFFSV